MATFSNTPRPAYVFDTTDNVWYPVGTGAHSHNEIVKTTIDAKGDLIVGTANDAYTRQGVGADGSVLVADSTQTTGVNWAGPFNIAGKNGVINGGMDIWQRGTSMAGSGSAFSADRWQSYRSVAGSTFSRQATNDTTNLPNIQYCVRMSRDSGNTSTANIAVVQNFETVNSIPFAGKTITYSFYARKGANYSAASSALNVEVTTGTGTDQNLLSGFTGAVTVIGTTVTLTTTWQRFTFTATLNSNITQIGLSTYFTPVGTAGAADYAEVTGVQLELGSSATPFSRAGGTIQGELAACQRYCYKATVTQTSGIFGNGLATSSTTATHVVPFPVTMRTSPTLTASGTFSSENTAAYTGTTVALAGNTGSPDKARINHTTTAGMGTNAPVMFCASNDTNAYLLFSAEL